MGEDRYSYGYNYRINPVVGTGIFLATMLTLAGISYLAEPYPTVHPRVSTPNGIFSVDGYKSVVDLTRYFSLPIYVSLYQYMFQMERQFPQKDVVHYTFESADS